MAPNREIIRAQCCAIFVCERGERARALSSAALLLLLAILLHQADDLVGVSRERESNEVRHKSRAKFNEGQTGLSRRAAQVASCGSERALLE